MAKAKQNIQLHHSNEPQLTISNKLKIRLDDMNVIEPLTENQRRFFEAYDNSNIMLLHGVAGTGKTYIALYHALEEVFINLTNTSKLL